MCNKLTLLLHRGLDPEIGDGTGVLHHEVHAVHTLLLPVKTLLSFLPMWEKERFHRDRVVHNRDVHAAPLRS